MGRMRSRLRVAARRRASALKMSRRTVSCTSAAAREPAPAANLGGERLPEHHLAHLRIEVLAEALVKLDAAALARLGKFDEHRIRHDRGGIGANICYRL